VRDAASWRPCNPNVIGTGLKQSRGFTFGQRTLQRSSPRSELPTAHLAEAFRMTYEIHHGGNSLNNVANLHVVCGIPNSEFFEVILPDEVQKFGLVDDLEVSADGMVKVPQAAGLGVEIDFDLIRRNTKATLS